MFPNAVNAALASEPAADRSVEIRVRGRVQGVGFRPTVWRHARDLGVSGEVLNDAEGVLIRAAGSEAGLAAFVDRIATRPPPLARIDQIETQAFYGDLPKEFRIAETRGGEAHTQIAPDAAVCSACANEVLSSTGRRRQYAFTNCTHCGPRLSIVEGIPYDRSKTTMANFPLCDACSAEYGEPEDRRFHAEAIACLACGPRLALVRLNGVPETLGHSAFDDLDRARALIEKGEILAIKGLGGYQLTCDAANRDVIVQLRHLKKRDAKPFALMARDIDVVRRYCSVSSEEQEELTSSRAPILLLRADGPERLPDTIAPGMNTLGFMLPTTPLHLLLFRALDRPLVMTSGNWSDEPQVIKDADACERLAGIASYALMHDRPIANRLDDSVSRVMGKRVRVLRRARGFAPEPIRLPPGFESAPELLAMGGELKATFCLIKDGQAILSQHQGDLEHAATWRDYCENLALYRNLFDHRPVALAADRHPEYLSSKLAREKSRAESLPLVEVQHHHAHVAACLAESGYPLDAPPALGIVLDGLGWGDDGTIWGGEFLLADYRRSARLATFKPVGMPGGAQAVREPWRNLYAHLKAAMGWAEFSERFSQLDLQSYLSNKPVRTLDVMGRKNINTPMASSCGRLFDAVAAALGVCCDKQAYEGEAAARLEALVDREIRFDAPGYPLSIVDVPGSDLLVIEPREMWNALLRDLSAETPTSIMATQFHRGLSRVVADMTKKLARPHDESNPRFRTVALSGGCFQNRVLFEDVVERLEKEGFDVRTHAQVPASDGGLSLGQAAIAAALLSDRQKCIEGIP